MKAAYAAIYARTAIADQRIQSQLTDLRQIAAERGFEVVAECRDIGISGTKSRRPGLDTLMRDAQNRKFDVVLVTSIDRVARSTKHFVQIMNEMDALGIRFVSLREGIDTAGATGRQFLWALRSVAALERSLVGERIKVAMRRAKSEGQRMGRAPLDVDRTAIVRDRLAGMSLTDVATKHLVSRASVVRFTREAQRVMCVLGSIPVGQQRKAIAAVACIA
jgi:DNA invertase Pin-like site-specific DNA recombinase